MDGWPMFLRLFFSKGKKEKESGEDFHVLCFPYDVTLYPIAVYRGKLRRYGPMPLLKRKLVMIMAMVMALF